MGLSNRGRRPWRRRQQLLWAVVTCSLPSSSRAQSSRTSSVLSYGWLAQEKEVFCRYVATPPPQLNDQALYLPVAHDSQVNFDTRQLVSSWRGQNQLDALMQSCQLTGSSSSATSSTTCNDELLNYAMGLAPLAAPVAATLLIMAIWWVCCWMAFCRCCRRCCLCSERKGPRPAGLMQKISIVLGAFVGTIIIMATSGVAYTMSGEISSAIGDSLCHMLNMADEALNGSPATPTFLGIDEGIQRMRVLRSLLDVDGQAMTDVRGILDDTAPFAAAMDDLQAKIQHMQRMLTLVGQRKIKEHSCWFCQRAVGNNATGDMGLLAELLRELQRSSADAMRSIQLAASSTLTGNELVQISTAVRHGSDSLEVFKSGFGGLFVDGILSQRNFIQSTEDARHTIFQFLCAFCILHAAIVSTGVLCHVRRSTARYPTATPACMAWFCGFCGLAASMLFAGMLLLVAVPLSELCGFWRYELMTSQGVTEYYRQLGLFSPTDPGRRMDTVAADVFRACLAPDGSGEVLQALGLESRLGFQDLLDRRFIELEDKMAGKVIDTAKFQLLVDEAQGFGGLFLLDPDEPLPLAPNAVAMMIGSSVDADDRDGPDRVTLIYGLNTYAGLIAGAGRYSFQHGTSGGGTLITATRPTAAEVSDAPLTMQNALAYARLKEQLLSEPNVLRCDVMDTRYHVTERRCSLDEFKQSVVTWATQVREAGLRLGAVADQARPKIARELRDSLQSVLMEVRKLRTTFRCRFLWRRWEDLDLLLCNYALPGMLQGFAAWLALSCGSLILVVLHYKIWRHLLDNRIVGEELERFSEKYKYLQAVKNNQ